MYLFGTWQGCVYNYIYVHTPTWYLVRINLKQSNCPMLFALLCVYMYNFLLAWRQRYYVHNNMYVYLCV